MPAACDPWPGNKNAMDWVVMVLFHVGAGVPPAQPSAARQTTRTIQLSTLRRAFLARPDEGVRASVLRGTYRHLGAQSCYFFCDLVVDVAFGEFGGHTQSIFD